MSPRRLRTAAPAAAAALCLAIGGCSSAASPQSAPSPSIAPQTPDPCALLNTGQVGQAYATQLSKNNITGGITTKDTYVAGRDEIGADLTCDWSTVSAAISGVNVPFDLVTLEVAPAGWATNDVSCVKTVAGLGKHACIDNNGSLDIVDGYFWISIRDETAQPPDAAPEKQLGPDAVSAFENLAS